MLSNCLSLLLLLWFVAIWAIAVLGCAVFGAVCAFLANWAALLWSVGSGRVSKVDILVDVGKSWCPCQDKNGYWYSHCWKHPVFCGQYLFSFLHCSFYQMVWLSEITDKRFWCVFFPKVIVTLKSRVQSKAFWKAFFQSDELQLYLRTIFDIKNESI